MMPSIHSFSDELRKIAESKGSKREEELFERIKKESPVEVKATDEAAEYGGAFFDHSKESKEHIGISDRRFDSLAHEVGHAKNQQTLWGKLIQSVPANLAFKMAPWAGVAAGIALAKGKRWPLLIPAAAVAPILLAEALATNTGRKVLEKVKARPEEVETYRKNLRKSFSTYLQAPLTAATGGAFAYLVAQAIR